MTKQSIFVWATKNSDSRNCIQLLFCALTIFFSSMPLLADTVYLKDGRILDGQIVGRSSQGIRLKTEAGEKSIKKTSIVHIKYAPFYARGGKAADFSSFQKRDTFQEHRKGEFLVEFGGSFSGIGHTSVALEIPPVDIFLPLNALVNNRTSTTKLLIAAAFLKPKLTYNSSAGNINIEYALTDWFSFATSLEKRKVILQGLTLADNLKITTGDFYPITISLGLLSSNSATNLDTYALMELIPVEPQSISLNSVFWDIVFHLPQGKLDPYVKTSFFGRNLKGNNYSAGRSAIGLRYYHSTYITLGIEAYFAHYAVGLYNTSYIKSVSTSGVYFNIGYRFEPTY